MADGLSMSIYPELETRRPMGKYEVIIAGGGPAGLTAGLYTSRIGLKSLLVESRMVGGQIMNATMVENYPGFPEGISGAELASLMHQQAVKYGLEIVNAEVTGITLGKPHSISTTEGNFETAAVIIAAGSEYRKLGIPGEERLLGRGVSYCATCDGFFFRDREVAVIGGGDTAITDALELARHVKKVHVIHRRDQLRAGRILQQRALAQPKLEFIWSTVAEEIMGEESLSGIKLRNIETGQSSVLKVEGVFVAVGLVPNSRPFSNILELDAAGYIVTDETMGTSAFGVFAAGDIRRNSPRQVTAAVGDGAAAAISAYKCVQEISGGA